MVDSPSRGAADLPLWEAVKAADELPFAVAAAVKRRAEEDQSPRSGPHRQRVHEVVVSQFKFRATLDLAATTPALSSDRKSIVPTGKEPSHR